MKKIISILCVVLLLCSAMSIAVSAAPAGTIEDPVVFSSADLNMVKIPGGKTYYISFTDTTAVAKREIQINSSAKYSVTYGDTVISNDADGFCNIVATPDENNTYLFTITNNGTKQGTFYISFIEVVPYKISDTILYDGENAVTTTDAETTLYSFEPAETGI